MIQEPLNYIAMSRAYSMRLEDEDVAMVKAKMGTDNLCEAVRAIFAILRAGEMSTDWISK